MSGDMFQGLYEDVAARAMVAGSAFETIRQALADHESGQATAEDVVVRVRRAMQGRDEELDTVRRGEAARRRAAMGNQP